MGDKRAKRGGKHNLNFEDREVCQTNTNIYVL